MKCKFACQQLPAVLWQVVGSNYRDKATGYFFQNQARQVSLAAQASTPPRDGWSSYATPLRTKIRIYLNLVCREGARRRGAPIACHKLQPHNMTSLSWFHSYCTSHSSVLRVFERCLSNHRLCPGQIGSRLLGDRTPTHTQIETQQLHISCGWQPGYLIPLAVSVTYHALRGFVLAPGGVHVCKSGSVVTVGGGIATVPNM